MSMISILKASLWNDGEQLYCDIDTFEEMHKQAVNILPASILQQISMPAYLREQWEKDILKQISYYAKYSYVQKRLPISVPFVILKGTSASQYYPHSEYRTLGDIDIMTSRKDFDAAYQELLDNGYKNTKSLLREETFVKNGIIIELHRYFASFNDPEKAKYLNF